MNAQRIKEQQKKVMAEQARIRVQVRQFLAHLADLGNQNVRDHFDSLRGTLEGTLRQMHGEHDFRVCVESFIETFLNPGNAADLDDWQTVRSLQFIMMAFILNGLYQDPVAAAPDVGEAELTSGSSGEQ